MHAHHGAALPLTKYPGHKPLKDIPAQHGMRCPQFRPQMHLPRTKNQEISYLLLFFTATCPALSRGTSAFGPRSPQPGSARLSPLGPPLTHLPPGKQNQEASVSIPPGPGCSSSFLSCCQSHSGLNTSAGRGHGHHREDGLMQQPLEIHLKSYLVANSQPGFSRSLNAPRGEASRMRRYFL